jgi:hypothetical protein
MARRPPLTSGTCGPIEAPAAARCAGCVSRRRSRASSAGSAMLHPWVEVRPGAQARDLVFAGR